MKNIFKFNSYKILDMLSVVIIGMVLLVAGIFTYMQFSPVDVIDDETWVLCTHPINPDTKKCDVKEGESFHVGETISVNIISDKKMSLGGTFVTTAECKNKGGVYVSYPISEYHVNRATGHVETSIDTKISDKVPNLPATCRIAYVLEYSVYSFRSFSEYNFTNEFILLPSIEGDADTAPISEVDTSSRFFSTVRTEMTPSQSQTQSTDDQPETPIDQPETSQACTINLLGIKLLCS